MSWIPLHVHSQYSILDSTASVQALAKKAAEYSLEALAITDTCNMFGVVDFYKACKGVGVKAIIGCEVVIAPGSRFEKKKIFGKPHGYPLTLLAKNQEGYRNLCKLSSLGYTEGFYYTPRIDIELLKKHAQGLICLAGAYEGEFAQLAIHQEEMLEERVREYLSCFKEDFYLEIHRHEMSEQAIKSDGMLEESWYYQKYLDYIQHQHRIHKTFKEITQKLGVPLVASHDIHYIEREDWKAHEILMNIQSGEAIEIWDKDAYGKPKGRVLNPKRQVKISHEHYFKSPAQMAELFADMREAIDQSHVIAKQCQFQFDFNKRFYPVFIPPHLEGTTFTNELREQEAAKFLRRLCEEGIPKRYTQDRLDKVQEKYPEESPQEVVRKRLEYELEIIISKGMCDYLLIVYDFIAWAKNQGIPMGPGRGSGVGSIILFLIGITDIEPLRFDLFFERFINPERISYPDIDVDICMDRRAEVIEYTLQKYGKEKVAQIITFGTMKAKMVVKDVGRVLSVSLAKVNELAKLIPEDPNMTLEKALETDPDLAKLYQEDEETRRIIDLGRRLEGSIRNTGIHAAGLIICGDPLTEHIPVCLPKDSSMVATQFSMKPVESVGMLKIDFLGLKTLTCIQKAVDLVKESLGISIDWVNMPLEDTVTFNLLNQGKTLGVFQLESSGMQELAKQLHIDKFEEIIAVGALYRPGPMEMIPSFINRKHGKEMIEYDHPLLKDVLSETYGIMVYQEQVMQIASLLANYSLGEGDLLRRAMGKKDKDEMARQKVKFQAGAIKKGIDEKLAVQIFDKIEKFASYGFNKSHATAYGFLSYVTAYLKANFTRQWLAALMTCDIDDLTKVAKHIRECQMMNIAILSPDINESKNEFSATSQGIRFAMCAIKGIGTSVVDCIVQERNNSGVYLSLYDFVKRIDTKRVGKKVIETLIAAGCFDFTKWSRQSLTVALEPIYEHVVREQKEEAKGVIDLFSRVDDSLHKTFTTPPEIQGSVSILNILNQEKTLLGFFLTGHPMDNYQSFVKQLGCELFSGLSKLEHQAVVKVAFIIETVQIRLSKTQRKFALITISDGMEHYETPIWPDLFEKYQHLLIENQLAVGVIQTDKEGEQIHLRMKWLGDLTSQDQKHLEEELERAYETIQQDQIRQKAKMNAAKNKDKEEVSTEKKKELSEKKLQVLVKAYLDGISHSQVLALKKLFADYPGHICINLELFSKEEKLLAELSIQNEWGVRYDNQFERSLKAFPFIKSVQLLSLE